jgi:membrane protein DedA with SNARE-associated domain
MEPLQELITQYGIYAVFALSSVEGDITLLISGAMSHQNLFGNHSFLKVLFAGTAGGVCGDLIAYGLGRVFHDRAKDYRFYQMTQPRIERLITKFGTYAIIFSKYIYGIRSGVALFYGIGRMGFWRFLWLDAISCFLWVLVLSGAGYFFSGAVQTLIGDFNQVGIALLFVVLAAIMILYVVERYWLSEKVEDVSPETIHVIEEKIEDIEDAAQEGLQKIGRKLRIGKGRKRHDDGGGSSS